MYIVKHINRSRIQKFGQLRLGARNDANILLLLIEHRNRRQYYISRGPSRAEQITDVLQGEKAPPGISDLGELVRG